METFNFSVPQDITVGKGSLTKLPEIAKKLAVHTHLSFQVHISRRWDLLKKQQII